MLILHVISSMDPASGGPSQGIRNLDAAMQHLGVSREIVCADDPNSPYLANETVKIHALGQAKGPWQYQPDLFNWLTANIGRYDVIIINGLWLYNSYVAWKALKHFKIKYPRTKAPRLLVMPHGMLDPYFQRAKKRRLKALRNWFYWKIIERKVVNDADGLLFTCQTELLLARETFIPYHPKKEYNVGYGIVPPPPYEDGMQKAFEVLCPDLNDNPYLLFLSRIHHKKGLDLLIEAYLELFKSAAISTINLPHLVIAGPGLETGFGQKVLLQLEEIPEASKIVHFPGMLTGQSKWGAFYGCEAFVLPSHQENFGIAVAEALACSKPVLISDQVNIWREIEEGNGGIIKPDTLEGTKQLLQQWINITAEQKKKMSADAYFIYEQHFMVSKIATNFLKAFEDEI